MGVKAERYKSFNKMKWIKIANKFSMRYILARNSTFLQCKFDKGCVIPRHTHKRNEEILHIVKGRLIGHIGKKKYILKDGETIVIPPTLPHGWVALKKTITYEVFSPPRSKAQMEALVKKLNIGVK